MTGAGPLRVVVADITGLDVDVVVNAANASLLGGGGVDGAIHRAAGPGLREECAGLGGARTGEVKWTAGHGLTARHVAHAVGPVWRGGGAGEVEALASCYRLVIQGMGERGLRSVAFPAISTGAYGFPVERAAGVAARSVAEALAALATPPEVIFCCFAAADAAVYEAAARAEGLTS